MARYIVNSGGVVNSVNDDEFAVHLSVARQTAMQRQKAPDAAASANEAPVMMPREATPDEVAAFWRKQGLVYLPETDEAVTPAEAAERSKSASTASKPAK